MNPVIEYTISFQKLLSGSSRRIVKLTFGIILLLCGCLIYLTWRSRETNICLWSETIGLRSVIDFLRMRLGDYNPGNFVKHSLPDGLYCCAYILIMDSVWQDSWTFLRLLLVLLIPAIAIAHEIMQYFMIVSGTFDPMDLLCYFIPPLTYLIIMLLYRYF